MSSKSKSKWLALAIAVTCGACSEATSDRPPVTSEAKDAAGDSKAETALPPVDGSNDLGGNEETPGSSADGADGADGSSEDVGGPPPDTFVALQGEFGWICEGEDECDSGFCLSTAEGKVCSQACGECPDGWLCAQAPATAGDLIYLCVPRFSHLCDPCAKNEDCVEYDDQAGNECIDYGTEGKFCGAVCDDGIQCPWGYACSQIPGNDKKQCVPVGAGGAPRQCDCSVLAKDLGKSTSCYTTNDNGTCYGFRECIPTGLTDCSAQIPTVEVCNAIDDNCDNAVDNITIPEQCSVKNDFGTCTGILTCNPGLGTGTCNAPTPFQEICDGLDQDCDGANDNGFNNADGDNQADCIDEDDDNDGVLDPQDNCQLEYNPPNPLTGAQDDFDGDLAGDACDPDDDNDSSPDKVDCDPFNKAIFPDAIELCDSLDNNCNGTVNENLCDDGKFCTNDSCQADGSCVNEPNTLPCEDGSKCTKTDLCKDGLCVGYNPVYCDDNNTCTDDLCDPQGECLYQPITGACEDGNACTENDVCISGKCKPGLLKKCNDGDPCTSDINCSPISGCNFTPGPNGTPCKYGDGQCSQGLCSFGTCTPKDGASCNTGSGECPAGACNNGSCFVKENQTCKTEVDTGLCTEKDVAGICTSGGTCVVVNSASDPACPGCQGICIHCFIPICIPFGIFF